MKKLLWALSVVLVMVIATGVSADIRSDKCNTYSNDLGISAALDSGCLINTSLLDTDANLPYRALMAKKGPGPYGSQGDVGAPKARRGARNGV
jgi:hypothetical protein